MMSVDCDVKRQLELALLTGEWFEIIYHGGSNPGSRRKIVPIAVFADKVRARCYTSNAVKPFMLEKIEILSTGVDASATPEWTESRREDIHGIVDVRDVFKLFHAAIEAHGWRAELTKGDFGWWIHLYGFFKNGKPRKTPMHGLGYEHTAYDLLALPDGSVQPGNLRPRTRPWSSREGTYKKNFVPVMGLLRDAGLSDDEIAGVLACA